MTLTIEIPSEMESRLRDEAARAGMDVTVFVAKTLEARLGGSANGANRLSREETDLLEKINSAFSPETLGSVWLILVTACCSSMATVT